MPADNQIRAPRRCTAEILRIVDFTVGVFHGEEQVVTLPANAGLPGENRTVGPLGIQGQWPGGPVQQFGVTVTGLEPAALVVKVPDPQFIAVNTAKQISGKHHMRAGLVPYPHTQLTVLAMQHEVLLIVIAHGQGAGDKQFVKTGIPVIIDGIHANLAKHGQTGKRKGARRF